MYISFDKVSIQIDHPGRLGIEETGCGEAVMNPNMYDVDPGREERDEA